MACSGRHLATINELPTFPGPDSYALLFLFIFLSLTMMYFSAMLSVVEFEFENDNRVLSRDDIKRMSAELTLANQRRAMSQPAANQRSRSKMPRRRRKR